MTKDELYKITGLLDLASTKIVAMHHDLTNLNDIDVTQLETLRDEADRMSSNLSYLVEDIEAHLEIDDDDDDDLEGVLA